MYSYQLIRQVKTKFVIVGNASEELFFQTTTVPYLKEAYRLAKERGDIEPLSSAAHNFFLNFISDEKEDRALVIGNCFLDFSQ